MYLRSALLFFFALTILACGSNTSDRVHGDLDPHREVATDVKMFYCLLYTSPSPRDATLSRMPSSA